MNNSILECTAEDLVAHKLQRAGLLVAKPRFDLNGADLLALIQVRDGAKFARIQCKGRTLRGTGSVEVLLAKEYVTSGLITFVFIETEDKAQTFLYCFFYADIHKHWKTRNQEMVLTIRPGKFEDDLKEFEAINSRVGLIATLIPSTDVDEEFRMVIQAHGHIEEAEGDIISGHATVFHQSGA